MTMPASGALNMGGTSSPVSVNFELGRASPYQQTVSMNDTNVRILAGVSGTSGASWSMNSLYSKTNVVISLSTLNGTTLASFPYSDNESYSTTLTFQTNGPWDFDGYAGGTYSDSWGSPTTTGIGTYYWVRWTRTFFSGGSGNSATASSGWQQLSTARTITVTTGGTTAPSADYTIELSTSSTGSPVVATATTTITTSLAPG